MHHYVIKSMVSALKPVVKNPKRAEQIMENFWKDKIALVWDTEDVFTAANEREMALTKLEAITILQDLFKHYDRQLGLRWSDLTSYIEEYGLGRQLTKKELKKFVEQNLLTINRPQKKRR